jgi:hypothetical protein
MTGALIFKPNRTVADILAKRADPAWRKQYNEWKAKQAAGWKRNKYTLAERRIRAQLKTTRCAGVTKVGRDKSPLPDFKSGE